MSISVIASPLYASLPEPSLQINDHGQWLLIKGISGTEACAGAVSRLSVLRLLRVRAHKDVYALLDKTDALRRLRRPDTKIQIYAKNSL